MNNEDKEKQAKKDDPSISAASRISKVSGDKKDYRNYLNIGGVVCALAVIIVLPMLFSGGQKNQERTPVQNTWNTQDYNAELQANLAKLKEANVKVKEQLTHSEFSGVQSQATKQYIARQNQPTNIYEAPPLVNGSDVKQDIGNTQRLNSASSNTTGKNTKVKVVSATRIASPRYTIASGEFIHAVLETAINSDLPGMVRAVIAEPVYAYVGKMPLIPAGSRLIGQYSSAILQGQNRVMVVWNRIILPNGISIQVNSQGADELGRVGQGASSVNTHFFARFGGSALLSLIGAGAATYGVSGQDQYNSASQYRMAIAQSFQQSAQSSLQNTLPMKPTLHLSQGAKINVFVAHDMSFYNVLSQKEVV